MHTILLPYFSDAEVDRYLRILQHICDIGLPNCDFEFVLASSPRTQPSKILLNAAREAGPARCFECPSMVDGYPGGATAMFWDCMWHVANDWPGSDGFVLWLESDMCPVRAGWLDQLDAQWKACGGVLTMGNLIPDLYYEKVERFRLHRLLRRRRKHKVKLISSHINGGACYRRDLIRHVGLDHRAGIFDIELGHLLRAQHGFADSPAFGFSTMQRLDRDLRDRRKMILHGYLQDKDLFVDSCIAGPQPPEVVDRRSAQAAAAKECHPSEPLLNAILEVKDQQPAELRVFPHRAAETAVPPDDEIPPSHVVSVDALAATRGRAA